MVFVAEAFAGWLVGQLADAGRRRMGGWLLGSDQQRALQQAATAAIWTTAQQLRPTPAATDDPLGPDHLARVIDQVFGQAPTPAESLADHTTLLQAMQAGVAARLSALDDAHLTGTGQSSAAVLGVSVPALTQLLVTQLLREVVVRGAGGGPLTPLATQFNHDLTHLQGQQHDARLAGLAQGLESALVTLNRLDRQTESIPARKTSPLGRPIHQLTDPFALEVHRAIDTSARAASLPVLPAYIERDHDRQLQAIIQRAAGGESAAAVLVGGSSTGKTRACWEAVQGLPRDWLLWHPIDPSRPEAAADALPDVEPRTVIWLNEAQHYLLTPASQLGERVAAGLRELLRDPARRPVLLLGTIWPDYWATLTSPTAAGQQDDPHAQARALLSGADIPVPDAFTGGALRAVQAAARTDPRLAEAARHAQDGRITQFLAGAPALLERYRNAPPAARALIEAAMDARRLGHGLYLPYGLLEAAAPGYLTDQQWDELKEDWLEHVLAYCAEPCRGARGLLTRVRPRPGQLTPAKPRYRLADYLEQTGRSTRRTILAPPALWDAMVEHVTERDLLRLAEEAEARGLYRYAFLLYRRAVEAGDLDALRPIAELLERLGRIEEAIRWYQRVAEAGDSDALIKAAGLLEEADRVDEAIECYQRAAEAGHAGAPTQVAELLERVGRIDEAIGWYQRTVEADDPDALWRIAGLLEEAGRVDEAIEWYQRAAEAGHAGAPSQVAGLLEREGRIDEAIEWYERTAEAGDILALEQATELLFAADRIDEAEEWRQRTVEGRDALGFQQVIELLEAGNHIDETIESDQRGIETGDILGWEEAAKLLEEGERIDEVIEWLHSLDRSADRETIGRAAVLLEDAGYVDDAFKWYQRAAEAGDVFSLAQVAGRLEEAGRVDEAIQWLQDRAEAGQVLALRRAAKLLEQHSRADEAIEWVQRRAEDGDHDALRLAAELLEGAGRINEAIEWYQRVAEAGEVLALPRAVELLERAGRHEEAAQVRQYGLNPGGQIAIEWHY